MTPVRPMEVRREIWTITEYRDGCVYRTERTGEHWFPLETEESEKIKIAREIYGPDTIVCSCSDEPYMRRQP